MGSGPGGEFSRQRSEAAGQGRHTLPGPRRSLSRQTSPGAQTVITRNALERLSQADVAACLARHAAGEWGEVEPADREENELSLREGFRLLSVYRSAAGEKFWIIMEAYRSVTTVLMPEDY